MRLITIGVLLAIRLAGAEVTGTWHGIIITEMARDTTGGQIPAYMVLKQADGKVTGSAGASERMLFPILEGKIDGDRLTVEASPKEGSVLRFNLTVKEDMLEGDVEENGRNIGTARLKKER